MKQVSIFMMELMNYLFKWFVQKHWIIRKQTKCLDEEVTESLFQQICWKHWFIQQQMSAFMNVSQWALSSGLPGFHNKTRPIATQN